MPRRKGSKNLPKAPGQETVRKPYGSAESKRNLKRFQPPKQDGRRIDRAKIEAQCEDSSMRTTAGRLDDWLAEYNGRDVATFSFETGSRDRGRKTYICNRGRRDFSKPDLPPEKRRPATIGRFTGCEAKLSVYIFDRELGDDAPTYIIRTGEHNHSDGKFLRRPKRSGTKSSPPPTDGDEDISPEDKVTQILVERGLSRSAALETVSELMQLAPQFSMPHARRKSSQQSFDPPDMIDPVVDPALQMHALPETQNLEPLPELPTSIEPPKAEDTFPYGAQ